MNPARGAVRYRLGSGLLAIALVGYGLAASAQSQPDSTPPEANPGRPTVTNPASITPVGYLQFEQGYLGSLDSPATSSQYGLNQSIKLTVHPRLMLQVQSQPFATSSVAGTPGVSTDEGDVLLGAQLIVWNRPATSVSLPGDRHRHAYVRSALPTIAVTYLNRVHDGTAPDIDLGSQDRTALLLFSGHASGIDVHYDINIIVSQQSEVEPLPTNPPVSHNVRRAQFGRTFSIDRPLFNPNLQISAEIYSFSQPFVHATSAGVTIPRADLLGALVAFSYQLRPNLVFDCGFEHGLTSTSTRWQSFTGFTYLLPRRLWPAHRS